MPTIKFRWNAVNDARTCPTCRALHGHEWTFTTPEPMPQELVVGGQVVWNFAQGSKAHGHKEYNCRCTLEFNPDTDLDLSDIYDWFEKKKTELEALVK